MDLRLVPCYIEQHASGDSMSLQCNVHSSPGLCHTNAANQIMIIRHNICGFVEELSSKDRATNSC